MAGINDKVTWATAGTDFPAVHADVARENERLWAVNEQLRELVKYLVDNGPSSYEAWRKMAVATLGINEQDVTK